MLSNHLRNNTSFVPNMNFPPANNLKATSTSFSDLFLSRCHQKLLALLMTISLSISLSFFSAHDHHGDTDLLSLTPQEFNLLQSYEFCLLSSISSISSLSFANDVIVTISIGSNAARSPMVERCHRSVRHPGNFDGYFAVLTEAPSERYADLAEKDDKFIVLKIKEEDKRRDTNPLLGMKLFKTMIPRYVYSHPKLAEADIITYLDFDFVVADDMKKTYELLTAQKLVDAERLARHYPKEDPKTVSSIYFFSELVGRSLQPFHGGVFFLDRNSQRCLDLWGEEIVNNDSSRDQIALSHLNTKILKRQLSGCKLWALPRAYNLRYPTEKIMREGRKATFIHITNTFRAEMIPSDGGGKKGAKAFDND